MLCKNFEIVERESPQSNDNLLELVLDFLLISLVRKHIVLFNSILTLLIYNLTKLKKLYGAHSIIFRRNIFKFLEKNDNIVNIKKKGNKYLYRIGKNKIMKKGKKETYERKID